MKKTRILLLGSRGFIGHNLQEYFENNESYELRTPKRAELDLLSDEDVRSYLESYKPNVVINAAVCRNPKVFTKESAMSELQQDLHMFLILEKYQHYYDKMICFGSGAEFDKRFDIAHVTESEFNNSIPITEYGIAKYTIGKIIENSPKIFNLRIFGLFGKYENWKTTFISGACCKALKGLPITIRQNVFFDYLYIDDFCPIVNWFVDNEPIYHTYNIASGKKVDLLYLAQIVKTLSGNDIPIFVCQSGYGKEYTADNSRLIAECNGFHITPIELSIKYLIDYYQTIIDTIDMQSLLYQQ